MTDTAGLLGLSSKEQKEPADQPNSLLDKVGQLAQEGRLTEAETALAALVVRGNDSDAFIPHRVERVQGWLDGLPPG